MARADNGTDASEATLDTLRTTHGATTDAAVVSDANGTVIGFLRGIVKLLAAVIDTATGRLTCRVQAGATGGWSKVKYAAQKDTVQTVKGTQASLGGWYIWNPNSSVAYVQLFDVASATTVTLGTTVPDVILGIPPQSAANLIDSLGVNFALGLKLACTTTATGSTAPTTGLDLSVFYV